MSGSPSSSSSCSSTASRIRPLFSPDSSATVSDEPSKKKRMLTAKTVDKWIAEYDKDLNTTTWLKYEVVDRVHIESLKCSVCETFKDKLVGMRNYNPAFIVGTKNLRTSSFKDHAASSMHAKAMILFKKQQGVDLYQYAPIKSKARRLNQNPRDKQKQNAPSVEKDEEDSEKFVFSLQDWEAWMSQ